ncbi:MAG: metallophosphoesterase, partial [Syntrophomonas sp.]
SEVFPYHVPKNFTYCFRAWAFHYDTMLLKKGFQEITMNLGKAFCHQIINNKKYWYLPALIITSITGAILSVYLFGGMAFSFQGLDIRVSMVPAWHGRTIIELPPFGRVSALTHQSPAELRIRLEQVETDTIKSNWAEPTYSKKILGRLQKGLPNMAVSFGLRQIALGAAGAFLLILLLWRARLRTAILSGLGGAIIIAVVVGTVFTGYNLEAFREPEYTGAISMAPGAIKIANDSLAQLNEVKDNTNKVVTNIKALFSNADSLMVLGNPDQEKEIVKILLVSDLHSNPVGVEFIKTLAQDFKVDFLINAGDLTDFGSPLEASMTKGLGEIPIPQVFAAGNHDTPEISRFMAAMPNSYVLNGQTIVLKGLRILGLPDPLSGSAAVEASDSQEEERILDIQAAGLQQAIKEQGPPDILVVHNPRVAQRFLAYVPLVVTGHTHSLNFNQKGKSVLINPGTTGAAGLRGLYSETGTPYSAIIVYIKSGEGPLAADIIKYDPTSQQFLLERQLINSPQ